MDHSASLIDTLKSVGGAHIALRWFIFGKSGFDCEDPCLPPLPAKDTDSRIARLKILDHAVDYLYDAISAANSIADDMDPKCFQSIQLTIGKSLRSLEQISTDLDYTDPTNFDNLLAVVRLILIHHHDALTEASNNLEILCGLGGVNLQALLDARESDSKPAFISSENVERIAYEFDYGTGELKLVIDCAGVASIPYTFKPKVLKKKELMTDQVKLLLCVLSNKGIATAAKLVEAIYPDALCGGSVPMDVLRGFGVQCREINKKPGVELLKFTRFSGRGEAQAATTNIVNLGELREDYITRVGTKPSRGFTDREKTGADFPDRGEEE